MQFLKIWRCVSLPGFHKGIVASHIRIPGNLKYQYLSTLKSRSTFGSQFLLSSRAAAAITTSPASPRTDNTILKPKPWLQTNLLVREYSDRKTMTALVALNDLKHLKSSPFPALCMGLSGLLPFIIVPSWMILSSVFYPSLAYAQVAYGASILSFLGGIQYGYTIMDGNPASIDWRNLGYSVAPALIAWSGLLMPTTDLSILAITGGVAWTLYHNASMWGYPPWFKALRFVLSFVTILSLWTTLVCKYILDDTKTKKLKYRKKTEDVKAVVKREPQVATTEIEPDKSAATADVLSADISAKGDTGKS